MRKQYIKGVRGEIIALDDIDRIWFGLADKSNDVEVWVDSRIHSTSIFRGTDAEVLEFMGALDELFEPCDLSNAEDREKLKLSRNSHR